MNSKQLKYIAFILGLFAFLVNGDNYAASPLLLHISTDFQIAIDVAALSVTSYMLMFGLVTVIIGPLGDYFGKIRVILFSALGTSIFSILCFWSDSINSLIILRAINGAFASGILPVSVALVGELAPMKERQNVIGKVMGMMFLGGAVATSIGGGLSYFGSWRLVYLIYGIAELVLTFFAYFYFKSHTVTTVKISFIKLYKEALSNSFFRRLLFLLFLMGYGILGSFVYAGKLIEIKHGYNILIIGLILGLFGLGTVIAGRRSGTMREKLGTRFYLLTGIVGFFVIVLLSSFNPIIIIGISLLIYGAVFIALQSSFVTLAQETLPQIRGTVMSLASFAVVVGGSVGTFINGKIVTIFGVELVFQLTALIVLIISVLAYFFIKNRNLKN